MRNKNRINKKLLYKWGLILGLIVLTINVNAQKKEVIDGKTYYMHIVEKGHTLYGISKQYAIDLNILYEANPDAEFGLTIGETILIPFSEVNPKKFKKAPSHKGEGLVHKVAKRETLYSISKLYNVDINELINRNPGAESGIVKGDIIVIPVEKIEGEAEAALEPAKEILPSQHLVLSQETIYGIAQKNKVSVDQLKEANNGFPEGLKVGQIINIPLVSEVESNTEVEPDEPIDFTGEAIDEVNLGLLLPFSFSVVDQTSIPSAGGNTYRMTDIAMEFYRGVQMALDEQKNMDVNLFVYDITKEESGIKKFLVKKEVDDLDIIIGPLHGSSFDKISKGLKSNNVHIVSPMTKSNGVINGKPDCSKILASNVSHAEFLADRTFERSDSAQIIVIDSQLARDKKMLDTYIATFNNISDGTSPTVVQLSKYNQQKLVDQLQKDRVNLIVVPSTDKPFVSDFFTRLNDAAIKDYEIELYGVESWLSFDNISADQKNKWKLRVSTSKYFDYDGEETVEFLKRYYDKFNTIPVSDGYGVLGYDIANFYLDGIYDYGKVFLSHLDQGEVDGLITGFDFQKIKNGGWENNYKFILRYDSYDLIKE